MAKGQYPTATWDGKPLGDDTRIEIAGSTLLFVGALCLIKGDWSEFCSTFAFANWRTIANPCFLCWATMDTMYRDGDFGMDNCVWQPFTHDDYISACVSCEVSVLVQTVGMLRKIIRSLCYDRREHVRGPMDGH